MIAKDLKLDENDDLVIENGDFVIAPSDKQHIKDILQSAPGWYKEFPLVGFNPFARLNARNNKQALNKDAKIQLQADGYNVSALDLDVVDGNIIINTLEVSRD
jgi:hypothetical protein